MKEQENAGKVGAAAQFFEWKTNLFVSKDREGKGKFPGLPVLYVKHEKISHNFWDGNRLDLLLQPNE